MAQTDNNTNVQRQIVELDSLTMLYIDAIHSRLKVSIPRYKMYKTENVYNLIKLDTATGRVWIVQYGMGRSIEAHTSAIDDNSLLWSWEEEIAGRFDLYPTNNMYTFILLDTQTGRTWQVQWHTSEKRRFRSQI
jgi:hypothetical protein